MHLLSDAMEVFDCLFPKLSLSKMVAGKFELKVYVLLLRGICTGGVRTPNLIFGQFVFQG